MLDEIMQQNEKLIVAQNYGKFRSNDLLGHFIKHEPLISGVAYGNEKKYKKQIC